MNKKRANLLLDLFTLTTGVAFSFQSSITKSICVVSQPTDSRPVKLNALYICAQFSPTTLIL